jgi:hypothetical protein
MTEDRLDAMIDRANSVIGFLENRGEPHRFHAEDGQPAVWTVDARGRRCNVTIIARPDRPDDATAWIRVATQAADHLARDVAALVAEVQALRGDLTEMARANLELRRRQTGR